MKNARSVAIIHGPISDEEATLIISADPSLHDRLVLFFARRRVADAARAIAAVSQRHMEDRADAEEKALSEAQRAGLRAAWERHPAALTLPGLSRTLSAAKPRITRRRVDRLAAAAQAFRRERGTWPASTADLREAVGSDGLRDAWYQEFLIEQRGDHLRIISPGPGHMLAARRPGAAGGLPGSSPAVRIEYDVPPDGPALPDAPP